MTKNIGLPVKEPKKKAVKNESDNPFNGSLSIRGKLFEGIVIDAKAKTESELIEQETPEINKIDSMEEEEEDLK